MEIHLEKFLARPPHNLKFIRTKRAKVNIYKQLYSLVFLHTRTCLITRGQQFLDFKDKYFETRLRARPCDAFCLEKNRRRNAIPGGSSFKSYNVACETPTMGRKRRKWRNTPLGSRRAASASGCFPGDPDTCFEAPLHGSTGRGCTWGNRRDTTKQTTCWCCCVHTMLGMRHVPPLWWNRRDSGAFFMKNARISEFSTGTAKGHKSDVNFFVLYFIIVSCATNTSVTRITIFLFFFFV